ncbi:DNA polymerase III subunit psi [Xenorhabdus bovienii]|uniref:DNA polymerase III subunit psi n=1 Tax=Xenorhabdus bovienii str. Intermedium TaxID=1379677 RepID=A0A077QGH9_XENBV|nr:DNA polymerase III subunit psi [Xenorhabdus bovienii]MDE1476040.1 DNA polymerase III subunit psi [Xenorhabdus bovienii]MDE9452431.1 DNA polymerase III subunit psi [Xenorhabdus bovienii]MDE9480801.1 DNA polymerase III subunit psi [Xenorhabdus bovienii]MDE9538372.1 DNA polymerase III subunit psi [Xenorhabdus bovienii]MDE9544721.1 DNA polymerase III subunit psi [Xenorhabdus bovienii]
MTKRDRLLAQLGITQWVVRSPKALQGELSVLIPDSTRLLIITYDHIDLSHSLFADIFTAMRIDVSSVYCITTKDVELLSESIHCPCWLLGVDITLSTQGISLRSPALNDLSLDGNAKRSLWQQIYHYEEYFSINSR